MQQQVAGQGRASPCQPLAGGSMACGGRPPRATLRATIPSCATGEVSGHYHEEAQVLWREVSNAMALTRVMPAARLGSEWEAGCALRRRPNRRRCRSPLAFPARPTPDA
ncbi:hypothetical protein CBM2585_A140141 [Cupriavidus taiwanensis]|nr:hypothetical protein CBM2585_A140141 [Cupriavidus taiwanensis]